MAYVGCSNGYVSVAILIIIHLHTVFYIQRKMVKDVSKENGPAEDWVATCGKTAKVWDLSYRKVVFIFFGFTFMHLPLSLTVSFPTFVIHFIFIFPFLLLFLFLRFKYNYFCLLYRFHSCKSSFSQFLKTFIDFIFQNFNVVQFPLTINNCCLTTRASIKFRKIKQCSICCYIEVSCHT